MQALLRKGLQLGVLTCKVRGRGCQNSTAKTPCRNGLMERTHCFSITAYYKALRQPGGCGQPCASGLLNTRSRQARFSGPSGLEAFLYDACKLHAARTEHQTGDALPAWPPSSTGSGLRANTQSPCRRLPDGGPSRLHAHRCRAYRAHQSKTDPGTRKIIYRMSSCLLAGTVA